MRSLTVTSVVAIALVSSACTRPPAPPMSPSETPAVAKVAFFQDGSIEPANTRVLPAFLGMQLAFSQAAQRPLPVVPEVVGFDTGGDPATAAQMAADVAADPGFVAAIIAPYWREPPEIAAEIAAAGIASIGLSSVGGRSPGTTRIVAGLRSEAAVVAGYIRGLRRGDGICLADDGSDYGTSLTHALAGELRVEVVATVRVPAGDAPGDAIAAVGRSGCTTLVWGGFTEGAIALREALDATGSRGVRIVGGAAMKDDGYIEAIGPASEGTVTSCPCVDLSAATSEPAQRFVHDFQAEYSIPPGVFSAEGWDAAGLVLGALRAGGVDRVSVAGAIPALFPYEGLATTYEIDDAGRLAPDAAHVHLFRVDGARWVPLGGTPGGPLPLRTEGVLSVGSCRDGAPFAYRSPRGRLVGFDVELARSVAARLGAELGWTSVSCAAGDDPLGKGGVDVVLADQGALPAGIATSRVAFAARAAVVMRRAAVGRDDPVGSLGPGDRIGLVGGAAASGWARDVFTDSTLVRFADAANAYDLLERRRLTAVVDDEAAAWAAIEFRHRLLIGATADVGAGQVFVATGTGTELIAAVDQALGSIIDDGTYARIFARYLPGATVPTELGG